MTAHIAFIVTTGHFVIVCAYTEQTAGLQVRYHRHITAVAAVLNRGKSTRRTGDTTDTAGQGIKAAGCAQRCGNKNITAVGTARNGAVINATKSAADINSTGSNHIAAGQGAGHRDIGFIMAVFNGRVFDIAGDGADKHSLLAEDPVADVAFTFQNNFAIDGEILQNGIVGNGRKETDLITAVVEIKVFNGVVPAVENTVIGLDGRPVIGSQIDIGGEHRFGVAVALGNAFRPPGEFGAGADLINAVNSFGLGFRYTVPGSLGGIGGNGGHIFKIHGHYRIAHGKGPVLSHAAGFPHSIAVSAFGEVYGIFRISHRAAVVDDGKCAVLGEVIEGDFLAFHAFVSHINAQLRQNTEIFGIGGRRGVNAAAFIGNIDTMAVAGLIAPEGDQDLTGAGGAVSIVLIAGGNDQVQSHTAGDILTGAGTHKAAGIFNHVGIGIVNPGHFIDRGGNPFI